MQWGTIWMQAVIRPVARSTVLADTCEASLRHAAWAMMASTLSCGGSIIPFSVSSLAHRWSKSCVGVRYDFFRLIMKPIFSRVFRHASRDCRVN